MDDAMALVALFTGVVVLLTTIVTLVLTLVNKRKVEQVHVLVNSQMTAVVARVEQLVKALEASDTEVPPPPDQRKES